VSSKCIRTMFNNLSDKLDKAFHVLKGHGSITEVNVLPIALKKKH